MMKITASDILLFLLASSAADAQSASQPAAPPLALLHNRDPSFVPVVVAFGCTVLFVGFFRIYLRHCSDTNIAVGDPPGAFTTCCSCGPHGIDPKLLDTFPILAYSTITHLKLRSVPLECAVCLSEFNHHDTLRLLPKCNHVFHRDCIDAWLASHVTCPVCRAWLKPDRHRCDNEVTIVIPNELNAYQEFDESSVSRIELSFGERRSLGRFHSTGHSLDFGEGGRWDLERYTLRLPDDVRKQVMANYGRSASYGGCPGRQGEGSSREPLDLSLKPPFASHGNVSASSSSPHHITVQVEGEVYEFEDL